MHKPAPSRPLATDSGFASIDGGNLLVQLSQKANQLLKQGALDEAERLYREILELEPDNAYALVGMARAAKLLGDAPGAQQYYLECLAHAPFNRFALIGLADCYRADGQLAKAMELWKKLLSLDDKDLSVLTRMADAYRKSRHFEEARRMYERALAVDAQHVYALIGLGYVHYELKEFPKALLRWHAADQANPGHNDLRLLTNLGNCYRKLGQFDVAIPYFERVLKQEEDNFYALFGLADCYRGLHQTDPSLLYWNRILALQPVNKIVLTRAADALRHLGRLDEAQAHYQRALDIGPDVYALTGLALVARAQRRYAQALTLLQQIREAEPDNARVQGLIAECGQLAAQANGKP